MPPIIREYGLSTYNYHTDGSGICHASWLRPMLNVRSGYITYPDASDPRLGPAALPGRHASDRVAGGEGLAYDVITDEELDREGVELLKPYRVVMTGSHPEYHTGAMLDALEAYRDGGGRLMYLGGNGFYWKVARHKELPAAIEIRRGEGGIRAWAAEAGEYYNAFDGEYGGLWRRNGRPPQSLAGVGFTAQGNFVGSHYRVKPEARASRAAWILDGIERRDDRRLRPFGAWRGRLRARPRRQAARHAGARHRARGVRGPRAGGALGAGAGGDADAPDDDARASRPTLIRADLTFFETPNNGAVFSTGSITFCGSLPAQTVSTTTARGCCKRARSVSRSDAKFEVPER